jgi:hypothetical protein
MLIGSFETGEPELRAWAVTTRPDGAREVLGERPILSG